MESIGIPNDHSNRAVFLIANAAPLPSIFNMFLRLSTIIAATAIALSLSSCCCM